MRFLVQILVTTAAALVGAESIRAQSPDARPGLPRLSADEKLNFLKKDTEILQFQLAETATSAPQDDKLKKQVELLQKQIETQQKMIDLLVEQMKKQPVAGGPVVEKLQQQFTTLD